MIAATAQHLHEERALVTPLNPVHQTTAFLANQRHNLYGKATDSNYRQLYELTINKHCLINQGALIDSELLTTMRQLPVTGYQALLAGSGCPCGSLAQLLSRDYAYQWHLRNAPTNGPALRQRAFLTPQFRLEFVRPCLFYREAGGSRYPQGRELLLLAVSQARPSPGPKAGLFPLSWR